MLSRSLFALFALVGPTLAQSSSPQTTDKSKSEATVTISPGAAASVSGQPPETDKQQPSDSTIRLTAEGDPG